MDLRGVSVKHDVFGEGIINDYDEKYLVISFPAGDKKFVYPDAFEKFLSVSDDKIAEFINLEIEKNKPVNYVSKPKTSNKVAKSAPQKLPPAATPKSKPKQYSAPPDESYDWDYFMDEFYPSKETLLSIKRDQEDKIKEIVRRRKINYLVHFTRIDNLSSILERGLVPVSVQQKMKVFSVHNDEQRIDSQLDCTSCSVEFPNYKLFYTFKEQKFPGTSWVVLAIDKDVLFSPSNIMYYCETNAASVRPRISSAKDLCTAAAFENMFCDSFTTKDKLIQRASLQIEDHLTTDPQAEILISDIIDKRYIACIYFQTQRDLNKYIAKNGKELLEQYNYKVDQNFYNPRKDYVFWQKES